MEALPRFNRDGQSLDVLIRARPEAYNASFGELRSELAGLTEALCSGEG